MVSKSDIALAGEQLHQALGEAMTLNRPLEAPADLREGCPDLGESDAPGDDPEAFEWPSTREHSPLQLGLPGGQSWLPGLLGGGLRIAAHAQTDGADKWAAPPLGVVTYIPVPQAYMEVWEAVACEPEACTPEAKETPPPPEAWLLRFDTDGVVSVGSVGHPQCCAAPCKYASRRGCKDGAACARCHLCPWTRELERLVAKKAHLGGEGPAAPLGFGSFGEVKGTSARRFANSVRGGQRS